MKAGGEMNHCREGQRWIKEKTKGGDKGGMVDSIIGVYRKGRGG